ncbi:MAG: hypothetical protein ACRD1T_02355 [Acidimicrobiia bacterium]
MLDLISDNADFLIATANTALDASLVPTMLNQRQDKASTNSVDYISYFGGT